MAWPAATDLCGRALVPQLAGLRLGSAVCHLLEHRSMCRETEDGCPGRARSARPTHPPFQSQERRPGPERGAGATVPPASLPSWGGGTGTGQPVRGPAWFARRRLVGPATVAPRWMTRQAGPRPSDPSAKAARRCAGQILCPLSPAVPRSRAGRRSYAPVHQDR